MKDVQKPEGPQQDSPWIIVTTLDGHLRALNIDTGKELWDLSDAQGPLIQDQWSNRVSESDSDPNAATSSETSLQEYRGPGSSFSEGPVYIVEPKQHGRLYVYQKAQPIRRLPMTVKQLVHLSPFQASDGTVYIGKKSSQVLAIDLDTGTIVRIFGNEADRSAFFTGSDHRRIIYIGRIEYALSVYDENNMSVPRWNLSYVEYEPPAILNGAGAPESTSDTNIKYDIRGNIALFKRESVEPVWVRKFDSPVVAAFQVDIDLGTGKYQLQSIDTSPESTNMDAVKGGKPFPRKKNDKPTFVHIGQLDRTLYLLNSDHFQRELKLLPEASTPGGTPATTLMPAIATEIPTDHGMDVVSTACDPTSPDFPSCMVGTHENVHEGMDLQWDHHLPTLDPPPDPTSASLLSLNYALILFLTLALSIFVLRKRIFGLTSPPPAQKQIEKKQLVLSDQVLGYGSHGTVVFKGTFQGRPVAVKRLLLNFYDVADHEVALLLESDYHPHVIRYFYKEESDQFLFIALELCVASLADLFDPPDLNEGTSQSSSTQPISYEAIRNSIQTQRMLLEIAQGLQHLHKHKIVHRDVKPQNILIVAREPRRNHQKQEHDAEEHDSKPQLESHYQLVISDFGLCKRLAEDQSSFHHTREHGGGTMGWRAPETIRALQRLHSRHSTASSGGIGGASGSSGGNSGGMNAVENDDDSLTSPSRVYNNRGSANTTNNANPTLDNNPTTTTEEDRITKSVDVFAAGLVYYYVLTQGDHAFGERVHRETNILKNQHQLGQLLSVSTPEAADLVEIMIKPDPKERPTFDQVLHHPYFWPDGKRLQFLSDVSDLLDIENKREQQNNSRNSGSHGGGYNRHNNNSYNTNSHNNSTATTQPSLIHEFEQHAHLIIGELGWHHRVDPSLYLNLGKYRHYNQHKLQDLLRAIRNKKNHYQDIPPALRRVMGGLPSGYLHYFSSRFPVLFMYTYDFVRRRVERVPSLSLYFANSGNQNNDDNKR